MQEQFDKQLYGGLGGPRYGMEDPTRGIELKPKGDLYSFLPSGWGTGAAMIDSKRQQEISEEPHPQEREMGAYYSQMGAPQYYVSHYFCAPTA